MSAELIPLARPVLGEAEERAVLEVLRSGQLSLGPRAGGVRAGVRRSRRRARMRERRVAAARPGCTWRCAPSGVGEGDEVVTSPFSFVASANAALYERARPVFADIDPVTLNLDPQAAAAAVTRAHEGAAARSHLRLPGRHARVRAAGRAARAGDRRGRLRGARRGARRRAPRSAARGHPAVFGFYANKQLTTGEGGMVTLADPALKERIDSERNQGRAPDMGWLDHDRLGFNYRLSDIACALGIAQLERLDEMLAARARVAGLYREALAGIEGLELPCADRGGDVRGWFVFVVQLPRGVDRDETVRALAAAGHPEQALSAGDPPDELLPRALRPPRGRVPGLRGRRRALAGAAVLPAR